MGGEARKKCRVFLHKVLVFWSEIWYNIRHERFRYIEAFSPSMD